MYDLSGLFNNLMGILLNVPNFLVRDIKLESFKKLFNSTSNYPFGGQPRLDLNN